MIRLLCSPPGEAFEQGVVAYRRHLLPLVDRLAAALGRCERIATCPTWREYAVYLRWPIRQLEYAFALEQAAPVLSPGARTLDVGSGVTPLAYHFALQGAEAHAVDVDAAVVRSTQVFGSQVYGGRVRHSCQSILALAYPAASFDLISCISVLEHLTPGQDRQALAELLRVLRPGGRLIVTVDFRPWQVRTAYRVGHGRLAGAWDLLRAGRVAAVGRGVAAVLAGRRPGPAVPYTAGRVRRDLLRPHRGRLLCPGRPRIHVNPRTIRRFWDAHWRPGLFYERGDQTRDYVAVGIVWTKVTG